MFISCQVFFVKYFFVYFLCDLVYYICIMGTIRKTPENPYGLTAKQKLVIEDALNNLEKTGKLKLVNSHRKIYDGKNPKTPNVIASKNLSKVNFRQALLDGLKKRGIIGVGGKIERRLVEGLDAMTSSPTGKKMVDYKARLAYIQEINKISGVYAPQKTQSTSFSLNVNMSEEEINKRIEELQKELREEIEIVGDNSPTTESKEE